MKKDHLQAHGNLIGDLDRILEQYGGESEKENKGVREESVFASMRSRISRVFKEGK